MPRIKKTIIVDNVEIEPIIAQEEQSTITNPVVISDDNNMSPATIQTPLAKISKEEFKQLHIKDTYWVENDIYQTIEDLTQGKKGAKALLINQALKDYLNKNNSEIKPLRTKGKK